MGTSSNTEQHASEADEVDLAGISSYKCLQDLSSTFHRNFVYSNTALSKPPVAVARPIQLPSSYKDVSRVNVSDQYYHQKTMGSQVVSPKKFDKLCLKNTKTVGIVEPRVVVKIPWSKVKNSISHSPTPNSCSNNTIERNLPPTHFSVKRHKSCRPGIDIESENETPLSPPRLSRNVVKPNNEQNLHPDDNQDVRQTRTAVVPLCNDKAVLADSG